jgi:hypothetical protein
MKNVRLGSFLLVLTIVLAVIAAANIYRYFLYTSRVQALEQRFGVMERTRLNLQSLANEALVYSRTNPAIDPLLISFDAKAKPTNAPATTQPSSK